MVLNLTDSEEVLNLFGNSFLMLNQMRLYHRYFLIVVCKVIRIF